MGFQSLTIRDSIMDDMGSYECRVTDHSGNSQKKVTYVKIQREEQSYLLPFPEQLQYLDKNEDEVEPVQWVVQIKSYPEARVEW